MAILVATGFDTAEWATWWPALEAAFAPDLRLLKPEAARQSPSAIDIALVANPPTGSLAGWPRLGFIQSLWAGVDRLLADASVPPGVPLARMVDPAMSEAMAETALWAVLSLQRGFVECAARQRVAEWQAPPLRRADEFTVALLGLGEMGRATARRLLAHGYRVLGWSRRVPVAGDDGGTPGADAPDGLLRTSGDAGLAQVLGAADVVVNLLPLTDATRAFFDADRLAAMRRGAALVNLARGAHVVDDDLLRALDRGHLRHAVLDVFHVEPLPSGHPFWRHPKVTVLPHTAAPTDPRTAARIAAANVRAWRAGATPSHLVDRLRGY